MVLKHDNVCFFNLMMFISDGTVTTKLHYGCFLSSLAHWSNSVELVCWVQNVKCHLTVYSLFQFSIMLYLFRDHIFRDIDIQVTPFISFFFWLDPPCYITEPQMILKARLFWTKNSAPRHDGALCRILKRDECVRWERRLKSPLNMIRAFRSKNTCFENDAERHVYI